MAELVHDISLSRRSSFRRPVAQLAALPLVVLAAWAFASGDRHEHASPGAGQAGRAETSEGTGGAPSFMSYAIAEAKGAVAITAAPGGESIVAHLDAADRIGVGGRVELPAGLRRVTALWVSAQTDDGLVYGFVPLSAVELVAGEPPMLDLSGLEATRLLAPQDGVRGADLTGAPVAAEVPSVIDIPWLPATVLRWERELIEAGQRHMVDPALLAIVMLVESGGNPNARSGAGATGLMQVMPATARGIAAERGISDFSVDKLYDPQVSIDFGAFYLAQQLRSFGRLDDPDWQQSVRNAAVAYNGGPGAGQRYVAGSSIPSETRSYVEWVGGMWSDRTAPSSDTFERWWDAGGRRLVEMAEAG